MLVLPGNFAIISTLLGLWPFWLLLSGIFGFLAWQNNRKAINHLQSERCLLMLQIPRANDKKELAAEQMFASLHGILRPRKELIKEGLMQDHLSFEVAAIEKHIRFYVSIPAHLKNFVEGQIYAQYPTVQIIELEHDYAARDITQPVVHSSEINLLSNEVLPIKTFPNFEVDPLAAVTATLAKLEDEGEEMWLQFLMRPVDDSWHKRSSKFIEKIKSGGSLLGGDGWGVIGWFVQALEALSRPPEMTADGKKPELSDRDRARIKAVEEKSNKLGYQVKTRVVYVGSDKTIARLRMQAMIGTFKQFNTTNLNGFEAKNPKYGSDAIAEYRARHFIDGGYILNIEEVASIYHLPHTSVETPNIVWATSKTAEPPSNLPAVGLVPPEDLSPFGVTNFRGTNTQFGIKRSDRGRHLYIVGQTGTGKSGLLELLTLSDVFGNQGFAVIDPHGDYAANILRYIPAERIEDVVYFNPADTAFPVGFNPMEVTDPAFKTHISSELVGVLKRMFESWGPRLEYILRYTILALLDYPNATMLDITRMLTEKKFRGEVIEHITDPVVRNFWITEFGSWNEKFATEAVAPVLNKVGAFVANPMIRNIVGQPKSTINIRHIMDNRKILIVNLSRGLVGEDNAAILGALMVTKVQLAAMSRADIASIDDRRPFYLYVDEFQNFATESFATILSEARKYGLNLTVANQYISQMNPVVKDAVFGNVGSMVSFRVGADDASALERYYTPQFDSQDMIQLHNRHLMVSMSIDGEKTPPFSAMTLNIPPVQADHSAAIIEYSRHMYAKTKADIEATIETTNFMSLIEQSKQKANSDQKPKKPHKSAPNSQSKSKQPAKAKSTDKKQGSKSHQKQAAKPKASNSGFMDDDTTVELH